MLWDNVGVRLFGLRARLEVENAVSDSEGSENDKRAETHQEGRNLGKGMK